MAMLFPSSVKHRGMHEIRMRCRRGCQIQGQSVKIKA
jgi:hypothetical protein